MAKQNGKTEDGIYISEKEMEDLGEFLTTIQQYLLSHEARITAIEGVIAELFHIEDSEANFEGDAADEPADDSPER